MALENNGGNTTPRDSDLLTRAECNALRGIAILGIFLHNYCHWLNPVVKENEYQYFQRNASLSSAITVCPSSSSSAPTAWKGSTVAGRDQPLKTTAWHRSRSSATIISSFSR